MINKRRLQDLFEVDDEYCVFNREERNYTALLYHLLLNRQNLIRFLKFLKHEESFSQVIDIEEVQLYFEYAYLRDLWALSGRQKAIRPNYREVILSLLHVNKEQRSQLEAMTTKEFNEFFGASPRASSLYIQMPGRWSDSQYGKWMKFGEGDAEGVPRFAQQACRLKWAFNAKPDLVIQISRTHAICIEAKVESSEGRYKVNPKYGSFSMTQTQIQQFILNDLLGLTTQFVYLTKSAPFGRKSLGSASDIPTTWKSAFEVLDINQELPFVAKFLDSSIIKPRDAKR